MALYSYRPVTDVEFSKDHRMIVSSSYDTTARIWHRRRPYEWYGVAWLPEFWLTVVLGGGLLLSLSKDRRRLRADPA